MSYNEIEKLIEQEKQHAPSASKELIKSMLFDDRDSNNSDEDFQSFYENEVAMMLEQGRDEEFWRFADRGGDGGRGRGKKKKKAGSRGGNNQPAAHPRDLGMPSYLK